MSPAALLHFNPNASNAFHPQTSLSTSSTLCVDEGVLGCDTIRVSCEQGAESGQALRVTTAHKTDTGPDGKALPSESPLVTSAGLSLRPVPGEITPHRHTTSQERPTQRGFRWTCGSFAHKQLKVYFAGSRERREKHPHLFLDYAGHIHGNNLFNPTTIPHSRCCD